MIYGREQQCYSIDTFALSEDIIVSCVTKSTKVNGCPKNNSRTLIIRE